MTLVVTVGGLVRRPALVDGSLMERELLPLTLSFDHAVVDAAPAARFAATLQIPGARLVTWDRGGHLALGPHPEIDETIHALLRTTAASLENGPPR